MPKKKISLMLSFEEVEALEKIGKLFQISMESLLKEGAVLWINNKRKQTLE